MTSISKFDLTNSYTTKDYKVNRDWFTENKSKLSRKLIQILPWSLCDELIIEKWKKSILLKNESGKKSLFQEFTMMFAFSKGKPTLWKHILVEVFQKLTRMA